MISFLHKLVIFWNFLLNFVQKANTAKYFWLKILDQYLKQQTQI